MAWTDSMAGALFGTRKCLRDHLATRWAEKQTAIDGAVPQYTLPTVPASGKIRFEGTVPANVPAFPVVMVIYVSRDVTGTVTGGKVTTQIRTCLKWWFTTDGASSAGALTVKQTASLIHQDIRDTVLLTLRHPTQGLVVGAYAGGSIKKVWDVGGELQSVRTRADSSGNFVLVGTLICDIEQLAVYE